MILHHRHLSQLIPCQSYLKEVSLVLHGKNQEILVFNS